jgi:phosphoglycolate phosphatase-like HAD superfamily hydrolase
LQKLLLVPIGSEGDVSEGDSDKAGFLAKTFSQVFEPNSLVAARYLNNHFRETRPGANLAFENAIRDALYGAKKDNEDSPLLKEVRRFCIAPGKSPNLNCIITYNYDDLVEKCLKKIEVEIPFASIYAPGMKPAANELPIYHVHGYLPEGGNITHKNKVVLSEDEYHRQYSDVYGWRNLVQINKFKDYNCVFIGVSFSDPNLRRLLDISRHERGDNEIHHICFKRRQSVARVRQRLERVVSDNKEILGDHGLTSDALDEAVPELIKMIERFEESDASSFGVGVVWVDSHDEIPAFLKSIRSSNK